MPKAVFDWGSRRGSSRFRPAGFPCPDCGRDAVIRVNGQTGEDFFGCRGFPECRWTHDIGPDSDLGPLFGPSVGLN